MPGVSVIIPTYNRTLFLEEALDSVLDQTYPVKEVIIVDDGSEKHHLPVLERLASKDERILFIQNEANQGVSYSRNKGIETSSGEYISFLDDDDSLDLEFIDRGLKELNNDPSLQAVMGSIRVHPHSSNTKAASFLRSLWQKRTHYYPSLSPNSMDFFLTFCPMVNTFLFKREVFDQHRFDQELQYGEDIFLWLQMVNEGVFFKVANSMTSYVRVEEEYGVYPYEVKNRFHEKLERSGLLKDGSSRHKQAMRYFFFLLAHKKLPSFSGLMAIMSHPMKFLKFSRMNIDARLGG